MNLFVLTGAVQNDPSRQTLISITRERLARVALPVVAASGNVRPASRLLTSGRATVAAGMWPAWIEHSLNIAPLGISPAWIVLISAVMFVMYLTMRPKRRDPLASHPFRTSLSQQKALERDMQNVIVELSDMTRQMSAQLETRAAKLEQLMHDADAKIAELAQAREAAIAFTTIASDTISSSTAGDNAPPPPAPMRLVTESNPHTEDRWAEVYRLGDEGLTLPEIARRLARPNGEVELILALRPKPQPPQDQPAYEPEPSSIASGQ